MNDPPRQNGSAPERRQLAGRRQALVAGAMIPPPVGYERRGSAAADRRASNTLPNWPSQSGRRSEQLLHMLAHALARSSGASVPVPRQVAELLHAELHRLTRGLWSAQDVAHFLGVHRNWVYLQAEAGSLPCVRIGGLVRFDPEIIRAIGRGERVKGGRVIAVPVARNRNDRK